MNLNDAPTSALCNNHKRSALSLALSCSLLLLVIVQSFAASLNQGNKPSSLTPLQIEIEKQRQQLSSAEIEERREAVMQLGAMHHPEASRAAAAALKDPLPMVRATAARAILWLPPEEAAMALILLLADKDELVRQESAYALGQTRSTTAVAPLIERLTSDKKNSVRGAAAVALGEIANEEAVDALTQLLSSQMVSLGTKKASKSKRSENAFVLRSAAHSLGQIASRRAVPTLVALLEDETMEDDVRREAAFALGAMGDSAAIPALQKALNADDPYLSMTAQEALRKITISQSAHPDYRHSEKIEKRRPR
jgi:HEAT repeat protein